MKVWKTESSEVLGRINRLKPVMKTLSKIEDVPHAEGVIVSGKADGEFNILEFQRNGETTITNRWGSVKTDFPAINELVQALDQTEVSHAVLKCELYAKQNGKPLKLPDLIHLERSQNPTDHENLYLGIFDIVSINHHPVNHPLAWKLEEVAKWVNGLRHVHVLPHRIAKNKQDLTDFWNEYVIQQGFEGVVITDEQTGNTYKAKPEGDVDVVLIALKKTKSYLRKEIATVRVALMKSDSLFIELGDVAGIELPTRRKLFELTAFSTGQESREYVYIEPIVVCRVKYTDTFPAKQKTFTYNGKQYQWIGQEDYVSLRHPRLDCFLPTKNVNPHDLRLEQIPKPIEVETNNG